MDRIEDKTGLNIYQRLNEIRKAVSYIQKDKKVEGYKAITHDMVTSEVRPHLIEQGVMVVPRLQDYKSANTGKTTKSGTPITAYAGVYEIDFVNIDDPEDKVMVTVGSIAEDHGDKGPGKAISYATKYAMLKLFSIETGESDESRQDQKPEYISADQITEINDLIKEKKADKKKFLEFAKAGSVEKILQSNYANLITQLKNKR
jgi:hypothetical protein